MMIKRTKIKNRFSSSTAMYIALTLLISSCSNNEKVPSYLQEYQVEYLINPKEANLNWFKDAKYGMFIHYGLYSLLEKGEWVQLKDTIPVAEYAKLKDRFSAENFDADKITNTAKEAGMKYITITAKHHDGFALFDTKVSNFNVMNSPAKRDLIKELYDACEEKGLGLFLYYSYAADWKHPYFYPRGKSGWLNSRPAYSKPQPEYKFKKDEDFKIYIDFVHEQLKEIFTQYPNIAGIWFDPIKGYYNRPDLFPIDSTYALVRGMSPHALISFKQGANGNEDFIAPEGEGNARIDKHLEVARIAHEKNKNKPIEICNTLHPGWGYNKKDDGNHKSADDIINLLDNAKQMNANLLLNVGPKGDGSLPEEDVLALIEAGKKLKNK